MFHCVLNSPFDWQVLAWGTWVSLSHHATLILSVWSLQKTSPICILKFSYPLPQLSIPYSALMSVCIQVDLLLPKVKLRLYMFPICFYYSLVLKRSPKTLSLGEIKKSWNLQEVRPSGRNLGRYSCVFKEEGTSLLLSLPPVRCGLPAVIFCFTTDLQTVGVTTMDWQLFTLWAILNLPPPSNWIIRAKES